MGEDGGAGDYEAPGSSLAVLCDGFIFKVGEFPTPPLPVRRDSSPTRPGIPGLPLHPPMEPECNHSRERSESGTLYS